MPTASPDRAARLARKAQTANTRASAPPKEKDNCLNIGRDDIAPALFMHSPRAPETGGGRYNNQRRFGGFNVIAKREFGEHGCSTITMYRDAKSDTAELEVEMRNHRMFCSEARITLTADELQTFACALIDAAHDLRTHPASSYQAGGAP